MDPQTLLAEYVTCDSESAFAKLVSRYVDLVYSTALRVGEGDSLLAEDVTQTVFLDLARLAARLPADVRLGGWLHRHTCFVARKAVRQENRRRARERRAVEMEALNEHAGGDYERIAPALDEAVNQLNEQDRTVILLRFFEKRDLRAVGAAMRCSENAAQKRVARALDQLRLMLRKQGLSVSVLSLGTALGFQAVTAAPAGLAGVVSAASLAGLAGAGTVSWGFLGFSSSAAVKTGAATVLVAAGLAIPWVAQRNDRLKLQEENRALRQRVEEARAYQEENRRLSNQLASATALWSAEKYHELLRLRGEVAVLRRAQEGTEQDSGQHAGNADESALSPPRILQAFRREDLPGGEYPMPAFPREALLNRSQGDVGVEIAVDTEGQVMAAAIHSSSGFPELDGAALDVVTNRWRFPPGEERHFLWSCSFLIQ